MFSPSGPVPANDRGTGYLNVAIKPLTYPTCCGNLASMNTVTILKDRNASPPPGYPYPVQLVTVFGGGAFVSLKEAP